MIQEVLSGTSWRCAGLANQLCRVQLPHPPPQSLFAMISTTAFSPNSFLKSLGETFARLTVIVHDAGVRYNVVCIYMCSFSSFSQMIYVHLNLFT